MSYNQKELDRYRELVQSGKSFQCPTCPYCNGTRDPTPRYPKPVSPFAFWKDTLKSPKTVVAPMVDQSELPFRMFCRRYGADLAYTPMFHSRSFMESAEYRARHFTTCPEDRPLVVQFCGHDADVLLAAARHVEEACDAVDVNLGCPQGIAKRGFYGSYLMERWDIVHTLIHTLHVELKVPVTAKMRIFDRVGGELDECLTLKYADMLREAGAILICVHGRTRAMKGQFTGMADLEMIRKVQQHVGHSVPVIANGNILTGEDIDKNLQATNCDAVMSAEGLLWDPKLFSKPAHPLLSGRTFHCAKTGRLSGIDSAAEFLQLVRKYPTDLAFTKAHLFKMLHHSYELFLPMRQELGDFDSNTGSLPFLEDHVQRLRALEIAEGIEGSLAKVSTAEKMAAKEVIREAEVETDEPYGIFF